MEEVTKKAYATGIIARELNLDFDSMSNDDKLAVYALVEDAILDEPVSEKGKEMKALIDKEMADVESDYNQGFNFHKDLNQNKIAPASIFVLELMGKYAERLVNDDPKALPEMMDELVAKVNDLGLPVGYLDDIFNPLSIQGAKLKDRLVGQRDYREQEMRAIAIGIKHPKHGTLSPHLASLRDMDKSIVKLRETFGFKPEDFQG